MSTPALWLIAVGPLALWACALAPAAGEARASPRFTRRSLAAALAALGVACLSAAACVAFGPLRTPTLGFAGLGLGLYVDGLTAAMFVLVAFVGAVVLRYSGVYLDGHPRHRVFLRRLCLTLGAVLLMIVSGNLIQFALAWVMTSVGLNSLLLFFPDRPAAVLAARKKFLVSRLGDGFLIAAMALLYSRFHTLDFTALFAAAGTLRPADAPDAVRAAGLLLTAAALLKSAQFPVHGWLIEVMETPTPVSALLHAGIINAGGFLILRFAGVIVLSAPSLDLLTVVGGATALFGSVVMLTQTSIKGSLAYSTIAQMGFMMLECGLGAFPAALLHILAHSLYKAHAFLSSGSVIDLARSAASPGPGGRPHPARMIIAVAGVFVVAMAAGALFGATPVAQPGVFVLGAILLMGLTHLIASGIDERPTAYVIVRTVGIAAVVAVTWFALQWAAERLFAGALPPVAPLRGPFDIAVVIGVLVAFAAVTVLQNIRVRDPEAPAWRALYVHVANGLYVNNLANRLMVRFWPSPAPRPAAASMPPLGAL